MTTKQAERKLVERKQVETAESKTGVDLIWNDWLNSFQTLDVLQNEVEEKSLQAFEKQKELLDATRKALGKIEEESDKMTAEWKRNLQTTAVATQKSQIDPMSSNWLNLFEDVNEKVQTLTWNPSRAMLDLYSQSQDQLESNYKKALEQQQIGRQEALKSIETITEQMKQAHKSLLSTIGS